MARDAHSGCGCGGHGHDHDHEHGHSHSHGGHAHRHDEGSAPGDGHQVGVNHAPEDDPLNNPASLPADLRELDSIVARVRSDIDDYRAQVARGGVELTSAQILTVLDQALAESTHGTGYQPQFEPTIEGFQMLGLYEEVVQLASNTYEEKVYPDGTKVWVAVAPATWRACLERVRKLEASAV